MKIHQKLGRNRIIITESYTERVRFIMREMYASYFMKAKPNLSSSISVLHDDSIEHRFLERLPYYLPKYIENFQKLDISISGMDLVLTEHDIHPVDSKPISYDASIFLSLKAWIENGNTEYKVIEPKLITKNYRFEKDNRRIQFLNKVYNEIKLKENRLYNDNTLSIRYDYKLILPESDLGIKIQNKYNIEYEFNSKRRNTNVNLYFEKDKFSLNETDSIKKTMQKVIKSIYQCKLNLRGFDIFLSKNNLSNSIDESTVLNFEWAIRNLLANDDSVFRINETSR